MFNTLKRLALTCTGVALSVGMASTAHADIWEFSFADGGGNFGMFSYDDTSASIGTGPATFAGGGVEYDALSFSINGVETPASSSILLYNDFQGMTDFLFVLSDGSALPYFRLADSGSVFGSSDISELNGLTLNDFDGMAGLGSFLALNSSGSGPAILSFSGTNTGSGDVPAPATLALVGLGLLGLGLSRRRRRSGVTTMR